MESLHYLLEKAWDVPGEGTWDGGAGGERGDDETTQFFSAAVEPRRAREAKQKKRLTRAPRAVM